VADALAGGTATAAEEPHPADRSAIATTGLTATAANRYAPEAEQVRDGEFAVLAGTEYAGPRMPARGHAEVRARIRTQQTDEDLGHDAPARRSESMPAAEHLRLLENVEEQGRTPPEDLNQVFRERLHVVRV